MTRTIEINCTNILVVLFVISFTTQITNAHQIIKKYKIANFIIQSTVMLSMMK